MRTNAAMFRAYARAENQMMEAMMPRAAATEAAAAPVAERRPAMLRVTIGEAAATRLVGFRLAENEVH